MSHIVCHECAKLAFRAGKRRCKWCNEYDELGLQRYEAINRWARDGLLTTWGVLSDEYMDPVNMRHRKKTRVYEVGGMQFYENGRLPWPSEETFAKVALAVAGVKVAA